jgi:fused signal recognition particle receptor
MFGFRKRDKGKSGDTPEVAAKPGLFQSLKTGLKRTRENLLGGMSRLLPAGKPIDAATLETLEECLLLADCGIEATEDLMARLRQRHKQQKLADGDALYQALREEMIAMLQPVAVPLEIPPDHAGPFVLLMVGVNGAGKTTTIGKLARQYKDAGLDVLLAAGDTFRAAAVEQLQTWGERLDVPVVAQATGADPASVIYDALAAARARGADLLIADTAGRLHTKDNLMEELKKIRRVLGKLDPSAPHETLIVLDATTGQNALNQAQQFQSAAGVTGIALTKMDGTAKGGIIFAIARRLGIPIRFVGVGEKAEDLRSFDAEAFVDALLAREP